MPSHIPAVQDAVLCTKDTLDETVAALIRYYHGGAPFNYLPATKIARATFSGELTRLAAINSAQLMGNPLGRSSNAEVAGLIWDLGSGRNVTCYDLHPRKFGLRRDLELNIHPPFYYVERQRVVVFWPQMRRRYALNTQQLGVLAAMIRMTFLVGDFKTADLEFLDLSIPSGAKHREPRTYRLKELPSVSDDDATALMQRFADAMDILDELGIDAVRKGRGKHKKDDQGSLL